jgi:hypothetical protein
MEKTTIILIASAIIVAAIIGIWFTESTSAGNGSHKGKTLTPLPSSLDQYYPSGGPPILLIKMMDMVDPFDDISVNLQENDLVNAKNSFHKFSNEYDNISKMVPEWSGYFDKGLVADIGSDIDTGNVPKAFEDMGKIGETCDKCHRDVKPQVWAKYYWKDFDGINVTTVNPNEPIASWHDAMAKYLAPSFEGMITNLREGKRDAANQSFENFRTMLLNFKHACSDCHTTERKYFVSDDIMAMVNQTGDQVKSGNITGVEQNVQIIGMESCYQCHVLHQPAQMMKDLMNQ